MPGRLETTEQSEASRSSSASAPKAARAGDHHEHLNHPNLLRIGRTPIHFFAVAVAFFAVGVAAMPFVIADVASFFYQMRPLALVHTFTLGWITAAMMGVMYRYVPALTHHPVPYPRMALVQLVLYVIGVSGMIAHFEIGIWLGLWLAAIVVVISVLMFAAEIIPCLWAQVGRGVAETGMFLGVCFLVLAAAIGLTLGLDKTYDFLGGSVLTNLSSHVHFAALGWVTLTICAVSYRMLPAFLLPRIELPAAAIWQLYALTIGIIGLGVTLLTGVAGATLWSSVIAASLLAYIFTIGRLVRTRRMPLDWTSRHAICGVFWLVIAIAMGLALTVTGADGEYGSRIASAYGVMGLLGWISNFIIGMSYQLFPGFVARARTGVGWPAVTIAELSIPRTRPFVFIAYNLGVAMVAGGLLAGSIDLAVAGSACIAAGGVVYSAVTLWTLSFAYRAAMPSAARTDLRILPS
ncbi:hypothetical protein [Candidatus Binatus soli]|jgi:hypothetical protein|uniref:hypothetical protein n=1 Tax=Candidatus Binatus soli TaxID=1953413 RepID=UPI003D0E0828